MGNKILFGEQVTRLVHALAGKKHLGMGSAGRYIAERIGYSEIALRKMREGNAGQPALRTLEILAQIGCQEAGLDRQWASQLLKEGDYPQPDEWIEKLFGEEPLVLIVEPPAAAPSPLAWFSRRVLFSVLGSLVCLALWSYILYPVYPPPHELTLPLELLWGLLVGLGIAAGLAAADGPEQSLRRWRRYSLLAAGGILGGLAWRLARGAFAPGALEAFGYGLSYAGGFVVIAGILWRQAGSKWPARRWFSLAGALLVGGISALAGFLLFSAQPSFSNPKDIDLAVGLFLRLGLALAVSVIFPPPSSTRIRSGISSTT